MLKTILAFGLTRRAIILLGLLVFIAAGFVAFAKLNIEAYPNPAPVILEITAQAPGLSAEEMERYYTIPMEIGLYPTPGIDNIRSTSFYGLSFVRVTFKYGIDYFFAYTQAALSLQQNVTLPGNQIPQIQQSSLVGEVYRYQVVGPPHFGLTNLRTVQDWIAIRRLFTVTRRRPGELVGRHDQAVQCRRRSAQARRVQCHHAAGHQRARQCQHQCRRTRNHRRPAVREHPRHRAFR